MNYRRLNEVTTPDPYYMSLLEEMIEKVGNSHCLSKIDLTKGFYQIQILIETVRRRHSRVHLGNLSFPVFHSGCFQRVVETVLKDCENFVVVYIHNILVASMCWEEHLAHLCTALGKLNSAGLKAGSSKCEFGKVRLVYLGHKIGGGTMSIPERRVEALRNYPRPATRKSLKSFLGLASYF